MASWLDEREVAEAKADEWLNTAKAKTQAWLTSFTGAATPMPDQTAPQAEQTPAMPQIKLPSAEELRALAPWRDLDPQPQQQAPAAASGAPVAMPTTGGGGAPSSAARMQPTSGGGNYGEIDNSSRQAFVRTAYPYMLDAAEGDPVLAEWMLAKAISENGDIGKGGGFVGNNFCYDEATEVLTSGGWVRWPDADLRHRFATLNPLTEAIEYQRASYLTRSWYSGRMFRVATDHVNLLVTPEHRMWVRPTPDAPYQIIRARDLSGRSVEYLTLRDVPGMRGRAGVRGQPVAPFRDHVREVRGLRTLKQVIGSHARRVVAAVADFLLGGQRYGVLDLVRHAVGAGHAAVRPAELPVAGAVAGGRPDPARAEVRPNSRAVLVNLRPEAAHRIAPAGARAEAVVPLLDKVRVGEEVASAPFANAGHGASVTLLSGHGLAPSDGASPRPSSPRFGAFRRKNYTASGSWEPFAGMVYCATVPNGLLIVRRDGKVVVSGNSGIKGEGPAGSFEADTWEDYGNGRVNIRDRFAAYNTPQEGFRAFMGFLRENSRYAPALARYQQTRDAAQLFRDIHAAGYATDPIWVDKVESIRANQVAPIVRGQANQDMPRLSLNAAQPLAPGGSAAPPAPAGVSSAPAGAPPAPWEMAGASDGAVPMMLKENDETAPMGGADAMLPGDGGVAPQVPISTPFDPDQGPREATPGSVGAQPLPQTDQNYPMTYGPIEQGEVQGPQAPPQSQIDRYVPSYAPQAAQVAPTMPSPAAGAVQAGIDAAVESYNDPFFAAGPQPPRWVKIVSDAMQAFGTESAKNVARSLGVTDEEWFSVFGFPISRVDVAGFAGGIAADPTTYIGANMADPMLTVARGAVRDFAPQAVQNVGRAVGSTLREGAEAVGRGLQGVGREVAGGLMDLNPAMTPRIIGDGPGIGRAMADGENSLPRPRMAENTPPEAVQAVNTPSASDIVEEVRRTGLTPPARVVEMIGERPDYLPGVAQVILDQRRKIVDGTMTPRDVAKAYYMTVASQGADAIKVSTVEANVPGFKIPEQFWAQQRAVDGSPLVRPEEAAAAWLFTPRGQQALDDIERGIFNAEAWADGAAVRRAFGDDRFHTTNIFGGRAPVDGRTKFNMTTLQAFTDQFNDLAQRVARGEVPLAMLDRFTKRLNGVREAKAPFILHALGFGESPTIDAVEINTWLTGVGDISRLKTKEAEFVRQVNTWLRDPRVGAALRERITEQFDEVRQLLPPETTADLPPEVFNHILHHWIWDRMKGIETTHEGFYNALRNAATPGVSPGPRGAGIGTQLATDAGNALAGSMVGAIAPADTPEERLRNTALAAGGFPVAGRLMRRAGGALGTPGIGPNGGRPAQRTVEWLAEQIDYTKRVLDDLDPATEGELIGQVQDRLARLQGEWVDAVNARRALEPRIRSEVGRRVNELPIDERTASDFAGIGRERVSSDAGIPRTVDDTPRSPGLNSAPPYSGRGAGIGTRIAADVGASLQGGVVGAAAGAAMPADSEEERRQNALYGAGAGMVGMPVAGRVVGRGMRGAGRGTRLGIIPPHVADEMGDTFPVRIPQDPKAIRAIESIGGTIDPQRGVTINVTRAQGPQAAGMPATRGGVFYEAVPPGGRSDNFVRQSDDPTGVGGSQVIPARPTTFRSPLIISDAPGHGGFDQAMEQMGAGRPMTPDEAAGYDWLVESAERRLADVRARKPGEPGSGPEWHAAAERDVQDAIARREAARNQTVPFREEDVNDAIRKARQAGPEGSEARAQALKEVVRKYGGDEELIDPLLRVRGADASESEWAIRENILAAHARRNGYDGVVTVEERGVSEAAVSAHPQIVAAAKAVEDAAKAFDEAQAAYLANPNMATFEAHRAADEALFAANQAYNKAQDEVRAQLPTHKITELIDVREGANPTPGRLNPLLEERERAIARIEEITRDVMANPSRSPEESTALVQEITALRQRLKEIEPELPAAEANRYTGDPGFTVRPDIQRPPGAQWAGMPFDPASAAMGGAAGAMSEGEDGEQGDPLRTAAGILLAGVGGGMSPGARRALQNAMKKADALNAAGKADEAAAVVDAALRQTGGYNPRLSREPVLPGMEPPRLEPSNVVERGGRPAPEPTGPRTLADALNNPERQGTFPGMEPVRDADGRALEEVVQEIAGNPAPPAQTGGINLRRLAAGLKQKIAEGPVPPPQSALPGLPTPPPDAPTSWWEWAQQWRYSVGLFGQLSTAMVQAGGGMGEVALGAPTEVVRQAIIKGRPELLPLIAREAATAPASGARAGANTIMGRTPEAIMRGSDYRPPMSGRLEPGTGRNVALALETPGRVATQAPDAFWHETFYRTGIAQAAAEEVARRLGSTRSVVGATVGGLSSGAYGAATADENATPGERLARAAAFAVPGALIGRGAGNLTRAREAMALQKQLIEKPTPKMLIRAKELADNATYKGDLGAWATLGEWLIKGPSEQVTKNLPPYIARPLSVYREVASHFMPVYHTIARITEGTLNYVPGVGMLPLNKLGFAAKGVPLDEKLAQQAVGMAAFYALLNYAAQGGIRGPGHPDPDVRREMRDQGHGTDEVNIGGYWVPTSWLGRPGGLINIVGSINDAMLYGDGKQSWEDLSADDPNLRKRAKLAASNFMRTFSDYPTANAIASISKIGSDPIAALAELAGNSASQYVPGVAKTIARATDAKERRPDRDKQAGFPELASDEFALRSGIGRQSLPVAQDSLGREVENLRSGWAAILPRVGKDRPDPVIQAFVDNKVEIPKKRDKVTIDGLEIPLTPPLQRQWQQYMGEYLLKEVPRTTRSQFWNRPSTTIGDRGDELRDLVKEATEDATDRIEDAIGKDRLKQLLREAERAEMKKRGEAVPAGR